MHSNEVGLAQIRKWGSIEYSGYRKPCRCGQIMVKLMLMPICSPTVMMMMIISNDFQLRKPWRSPRTVGVAVAMTPRLGIRN